MVAGLRTSFPTNVLNGVGVCDVTVMVGVAVMLPGRCLRNEIERPIDTFLRSMVFFLGGSTLLGLAGILLEDVTTVFGTLTVLPRLCWFNNM